MSRRDINCITNVALCHRGKGQENSTGAAVWIVSHVDTIFTSRLVARFSCKLANESLATTRSQGCCVIIRFTLRRKVGKPAKKAK
jgi:hypothetical protein